MSFRNWLRKRIEPPKTSASRRPAFRCAVEALEDRLVPASFSVSDATLIEGASALVTVRLSEPSKPSASVTYRTADGTARAGADYLAVSGTLTFNKGETSKTILVPVIGDHFHESNETFFVNLSNAWRATIADNLGVVTIIDDDPLLSINDTTISEGNTGTGLCNFNVTLATAPIQTVTVNYATANSTATAGSDYQGASGTITFNPGETSKTVTVLVNGDRLGEGNETFFVNLSNPNGAVLADGRGVATIVDDEPRINIGNATGIEGNDGTTDIVFNVTLSAESDVPVTVDYFTADEGSLYSAKAGIDYQATSGTLTFAPGETSKTVIVTAYGDRLAEPSEVFYLRLSNAVNGTGNGSGLGQITGDEPNAMFTYSVTQPEGDAGTTDFIFTVILSGASSDVVLVEYATGDIGASAGSDNQAMSGTLTFAPGVTQQTITVPVFGDQLIEYNEGFVVNLSSTAQGFGMIENEDGVLVTIMDSSMFEGGGYTVLTVWLSVPSTETLTVDYFTKDGMATAGRDYVPTSGTLIFEPGEMNKGVSTPPKGPGTPCLPVFNFSVPFIRGSKVALGMVRILRTL